jgi:hypothetical protein
VRLLGGEQVADPRVTTSTIAYATRLALVKWDASQIQMRFFSQEISGNGGFGGRARIGSPGSCTRFFRATRSTVDGLTNTVPV